MTPQEQENHLDYSLPPSPPARYVSIPVSEYDSLRAGARGYDYVCRWLKERAPQEVGENFNHRDANGAEVAIRLMEETLSLREAYQDLLEQVVQQNLQLASQVIDNNKRILQAAIAQSGETAFKSETSLISRSFADYKESQSKIREAISGEKPH